MDGSLSFVFRALLGGPVWSSWPAVDGGCDLNKCEKKLPGKILILE